MDILKEFTEIRRVSTPWCIVQTPDYRSVVSSFSKVRINGEDSVPVVLWDIVRGHQGLNDAGRDAASELGSPDETAQAPANVLNRALGLPEGTMLFLVVSDNQITADPSVGQAVANLRDVFKTNRRTLILTGIKDVKAPALVADDMPVLREELPDDAALADIAKEVYRSAKADANEAQIEKAVPLCRGLTRFAAEDAVSRRLRLRKKGVDLDLDGLADTQRIIVEQSTDRALVFERESWTFEDVGGLSQWKSFMGRLFSGPKAPRLIVRWDEIDKSVSAASTGMVADNTGTSQDQLKVLLTSMEENSWTGCILVGGPGTGKSLSTICTGNAFGARTLVGDLGATKDSLVGSSERKIRGVMDVIKAIGGKDVLFLATANRLDTLPPELQRRFSLGVWMFDTPGPEERKAIWKVQMARYGLPDQVLPNDGNWVGSDIRNAFPSSAFATFHA